MFSQTFLLTIVLSLVFFLGLLTGFYSLITNSLKKKILDLKCEQGVFAAKERFMNMTEHRLLIILKKMFQNYPYEVFAQVDMASLVRITSRAANYYENLQDLDKSLDFVIVDNEKMKPRLVIELDGPQHGEEVRKIRDQYLKRIFHDSHIPFIRLPVISLKDETALKEIIITALHNNLEN